MNSPAFLKYDRTSLSLGIFLMMNGRGGSRTALTILRWFLAGCVLSALLVVPAIGAGAASAATKTTIVDGTFVVRGQRARQDAALRASLTRLEPGATSLLPWQEALPNLTVDNSSLEFLVFNFALQRYERRTGVLRAQGVYCNIFVEKGAESLLGPQFATVLEQTKRIFDRKIYPLLTSWFGRVIIPPGFALPDERIYIFLLDIRDDYGKGYVAGYFDSRDLEPGAMGNNKPVFFMDLDPGQPGDPDDKYNGFFRTLAHEFQHMINFSRRKARGMPQEERWADEGLSMLCEYLFSRTLGNSNHGVPPTPHLSAYLRDPGVPLTEARSDPWLNEETLYRHYGASFLFWYFLLEKYGGGSETAQAEFLRSFIDNDGIGAPGVDMVLRKRGTTFNDALKRWFVAGHFNRADINAATWGYIDYRTRLGTQAVAFLPLAGRQHLFNASRSENGKVGAFGFDNENVANVFCCDQLIGSGEIHLVVQSDFVGAEPLLAVIDRFGTGHLLDIPLDDNGRGEANIDLDHYSSVSLFSSVATTTPQADQVYRVAVWQDAAQLLVHPVPHPIFADHFLVVIKSDAGPLLATPTVEVIFNNFATMLHPDPVDLDRTCFVAPYALPNSGAGLVTARVADAAAAFAFAGTLAKNNAVLPDATNTLELGNMALCVSTCDRQNTVFIAEDRSQTHFSGLIAFSTPMLIQGSDLQCSGASLRLNRWHRASQQFPEPTAEYSGRVGLLGISATNTSWAAAKYIQDGWEAPITASGRYVWTCDTTAPTLTLLPQVTRDGRFEQTVRIIDGGSGVDENSILFEAGSRSIRPCRYHAREHEWAFDLTGLPAGRCDGQISCADLAGNRTSAQVSLSAPGPLRVSQALAFPNPARRQARVRVTLTGIDADNQMREGEVVWYDVAGQQVAKSTLVARETTTLEALWDGRNRAGRTVANGVYLGRIRVRVGHVLLKSQCRLAILR